MGARKRGAIQGAFTLCFLDESAFTCWPTVRKTWAPRGHTPPLQVSHQQTGRVGAISAVTPSGSLHYRLKREPRKGPTREKRRRAMILTEDVARFLNHLLRRIPGPLVVILDNASQHRGKAVRELAESHPRLHLVFLPPYSPDFNPDEGVWQHLKAEALANYAPKTKHELHTRLKQAIHNLQQRTHKIMRFWHATHLDLTGMEALHD